MADTRWIIFRNVKIDEYSLEVVWDVQEYLRRHLEFKVPYTSEHIDEVIEILDVCKKTLDKGYDLWGYDLEDKIYDVKFSEIKSQLEPENAKWFEYMINTKKRMTIFDLCNWYRKEYPELNDYVMNSTDKLN